MPLPPYDCHVIQRMFPTGHNQILNITLLSTDSAERLERGNDSETPPIIGSERILRFLILMKVGTYRW